MAEVVRKPNESVDELVKRFKKQVQKEGIMKEIKKREYFVSPSVLRRKKMAAARKRKSSSD
ncbi:MAG: 30S ribosomal protein S21 [Coprothermobacterota bacterium]|jgi:small subunit ribosomal protein S21|nr:30S ribosomal protein S21 [Caldisericota bacterium]MDI6868875.1 30S ribosomal protein S21 [Coprothermobacterota bacterium]